MTHARSHSGATGERTPHGWWLVGTDVQLHSDIDEPQLHYFREIAKQMVPDDKVILATAEPHWVCEAKYEKFNPHINQQNLTFLERKIFGDVGRESLIDHCGAV